MNCDRRRESIQPVHCILYKNDNDAILEDTIMKDLGDSIDFLTEYISFNNQHMFPSNIYVTGDLAFLVILLGKEHSSPRWCIKYKLSSKHWNFWVMI